MTGTRGIYARGLGAGAVGKLAEVGLGFATVWLLTDALAPADYGALLLALTVLALVELATSGGFERVVVYRCARLAGSPGTLVGRGYFVHALGLATGVAALAAIAVHAGAPLLATVFDEPSLIAWLHDLSWLLPARAVLSVYAAWYRARQRVATALLAGQVAPLAASALGLVIVSASGDPSAAVVAAVLVIAPWLVAVTWLLRERPTREARTAEALDGSDFAYGAKLTLTGFVHRGVWTADLLLLGALAGTAAAANYGVAVKLAVFGLFVHRAIGGVTTSRIGWLDAADDDSRRGDLAVEYHAARALATTAALAVVAGSCLVGESVLGWFGDGEYASAWPVLLVLTVAYVVPAAFGNNGGYLNMTGRSGWSLATSALLLGLDVALCIALIPTFGALGAALATLLALLGANLLTSAIIWRLDGFATCSWTSAAACAAVAASALAAAFDSASAWTAGTLAAGATLWHAVATRASWSRLFARDVPPAAVESTGRPATT